MRMGLMQGLDHRMRWRAPVAGPEKTAERSVGDIIPGESIGNVLYAGTQGYSPALAPLTSVVAISFSIPRCLPCLRLRAVECPTPGTSRALHIP